MKILVNTRLLIENKLDGIAWFTFETLKRITQMYPEHEFIFVFDRKFSEKFIFSDNVTGIVINPPARHPILWYIWFEISLKKIIKKEKPDVFLSPDGFLSLDSKIKSIAVIHDINFFHRPKDLPVSSRFFYNRFFPKYANKAKQIATVSEYSKHDISKSYKINPDKISVVYNGCNEIYTPLDEETKNKTKNNLTEGQDFFIFIGSMHPRKNITGLFKAFERFKNESKSDFKLVIVGQKMFMTSKIEKTFNDMRFKNDVIFTGRLNQFDLHKVLASAYALTFVPFFEGFGIPVIEAMNCDVPVVTSNTTSLPEAAGNAALFVDPFSVDSIKNAMIEITQKSNLRKDLIAKGRIQKTKFSWDKTADKLWDVIKNTYQDA